MGRYAQSFGWAAAVTALLGAFLVILKGQVPLVRAWMAGAVGDDWAAQGLAMAALFAVLGLLLAGDGGDVFDERPARELTVAVAAAAVVGAALIVGYFLIARSP